MVWTTADSSDTLRIRIWWENGGEDVVYDNGFDQTIGGGAIKVHTGQQTARTFEGHRCSCADGRCARTLQRRLLIRRWLVAEPIA